MKTSSRRAGAGARAGARPPEPTPPPGLAEFIASRVDDLGGDEEVYKALKAAWLDAAAGGGPAPTSTDVAERCSLSRSRVSARMKNMCDTGRLIVVGSQCGRRYIPNEPEFTAALEKTCDPSRDK